MHRLAFCLLLACGLWSALATAQPYTLTTLAGRAGTSGSADGSGTSARFSYPVGIAVDSAGNVYVADSGNHTIRKVTRSGVVSTLAGKAGTAGSADGSRLNARFNAPEGVAVDSAGNVYVADTFNHTIRKISVEGMVSTLAGLAGTKGSADGTGLQARFFYPSGMAVDSAGTLYLADNANHTIRQITPGGVVRTLAGLAGSSGWADGTGANARFWWPWSVAVDSAGNLYVADEFNNTIRKITPGGIVSTLAGKAGPGGSVDGMGPNARFSSPDGVAVDQAGVVYVTDLGNNTIRKITPEGTVSTVAGKLGVSGSADGRGSGAQFNGPRGIAVDQAGNLYVADYQNNAIRLGFPPPSIRCRLVANRLILSWPLTASNYVVEASSTPSAAAVWTPLSTPVKTSGDSFVLTNLLEAGPRFYRLRTP